MVPALAPASPQVAGHHTVGVSTGCLTPALFGDWPALVASATSMSTLAVELSALSESELPSLVDFLSTAPPLPFLFVSAHAPTKGRALPDDELAAMLAALAPRVDALVVHPDALGEVAPYAALGSALAIENMDRRKPVGQTPEQLAELFAQLPLAGLCLDVAHAASVDSTMTLAHDLLDAHGSRLRHVHVSSFDEACHHQPLTDADEERFASVLDRCRDVPWILEAAPRIP